MEEERSTDGAAASVLRVFVMLVGLGTFLAGGAWWGGSLSERLSGVADRLAAIEATVRATAAAATVREREDYRSQRDVEYRLQALEERCGAGRPQPPPTPR